jgi:hypothetical protein
MPHSAMPQVYFTLVIPRLSRRTHNKGVSGSTSACLFAPFTFNTIIGPPRFGSLPPFLDRAPGFCFAFLRRQRICENRQQSFSVLLKAWSPPFEKTNV